MRWILFSLISAFFYFQDANDNFSDFENVAEVSNIDTINSTTIDSCIIDFRSGILGSNPVYLGKTRFKEIKKMYGDKKAVNSHRAFFTLDNGFFPLSSKLEYPEMGVEFSYSSGCHQRGQRSFFQNHTVNVISLDSNCSCKTQEGVGIGSTYTEIKNALKPDKIIFMRSSKAEVNCTIYLSEKEKIYISFEGNYCKDTSEFVVKNIDYFILERN